MIEFINQNQTSANTTITKKAIRKNYSRRLFTNEEDEKLLKLVEKYKQNWNLISKEMKDRNIRQCKERYYHYLSPNIKRSEWNSEEDIKLIKLIEEHGKKWKILENYFSGRTEIDIRNRFYVLIRSINKNVKKKVQSKCQIDNKLNRIPQNLTISTAPIFYLNNEKQRKNENHTTMQNTEKLKKLKSDCDSEINQGELYFNYDDDFQYECSNLMEENLLLEF